LDCLDESRGFALIFDQSDFEIRCEWGIAGISQLAPVSDVIIIVDVLSFMTCVEVATSRGAQVYPYRWKDDSAAAFAGSVYAELANPVRGGPGYSLSPASLVQIPQGTRLVLPSPNGAVLSMRAFGTRTLAGCLRNALTIAFAAQRYGERIAVIPAGEQWEDGNLRPAIEDWVGAGAIISHLAGEASPEARAACAAYHSAKPAISRFIELCVSGKELVKRGFAQDVALASELNVSTCVPMMLDGAYVKVDA
jgi:2-phosphosulfolactate phosphatase